VSYAALFGAPVFAICALVMLGIFRDTPLQALGWALIASLVLTTLLAATMLLVGRIQGHRETVLYVSGNVFSPMIRFKHDEGANGELDAFLDALPSAYGNALSNVPLGEWFRLPAPLRSTLGTLYWPFYIFLLWPRDSFEGELLDSIIRGCLLIFLGAYLVFLGLQCFFYFHNPKATKEARAALLDGDYDAAAAILIGVLEKTPGQPYANFLRLTESLVRGDLTQAASCADVVEKSRIRRLVAPPVFGVTVHSPVAEKLQDLERFCKEKAPRDGEQDDGTPDLAAKPASQT
jgi:hypothetical protein